eukprot:TRINITY_DN8623_c0_g1_i1.p1 TRINITY_DN8623_c0_g1~~TRINITY_DN8623_c0_g1_i1.p1  ORF type:complete len:176 (+),score=44.24 TRINITY_DN8623_c0_g1_i1:58-585(+)
MRTALLLLLLLGLGLATAKKDQTKYLKRTGKKWLEEKEKEEGVVKLDSGLLYKVIKTGAGTVSPKVDTSCKVHYRGTLRTGEEFDSSYSRGQPAEFAPNQVIKGWTEALQLMHAGDKWELYIPSDLAYGDRGSPPKIPAHSPLQFEIELLSFKGDGVSDKKSKKKKKKKSKTDEL